MGEIREEITRALAGRYAVQDEIGRGGMATVYRARDAKHDRDVAIKVFHPEIASLIGPDRFLNEIRVTANLQHPHILPLFDSGVQDGLLFYVMPFVDGESVRDLLKREHQLPVEDAVRITREVASALDYAHRHGVVHRDIKPENILVHDGQAMVADFGIALAMSSASTARLTQTGLSLGTPQYMSPEQASGERNIDGRTDIYSLCAVLYEMLVGRPPFEGPTVQAIIAKVVTEPVPDVRRHRATVPIEVALVLERGLARLPADRFQSARELADGLIGGERRGGSSPTVAVKPGRRVAVVEFILGAAIGIGGMWLASRPSGSSSPESGPTVRFAIDLPSDAPIRLDDLTNLALSQNGDRLVYVAQGRRGSALHVRDLADTTFREVRGTANASGPFFSPDGRAIGFFAEGKLRKVAIGGGTAIDLADAALPRGADWSTDGAIAFTAAPGSGLWLVPDTGGRPEVLTHLDSVRGERTHRFPVLDREAILATVRTGGQPSFDQAEIVAFRGDGSSRRELVSGGSQPRLLGDVLLFVRGNTLYGVRLSQDHTSRAGEPVALVDSVLTVPSTGAAQYDVSENGTLAYVVGAEWRPRRIVAWLRGGRETRLASDVRPFSAPRISPDGRWIAVMVEDANDDLWIYDAGTGTGRRLTFEAGSHIAPVWSPEGSMLAYSSNVAGHYNVYVRAADGSGVARRIAPSDDIQFASGWTRDGQSLAFTASSIASGFDVWIADAGGGRPSAFLSSPFNEYGAVFSPDGRWVAYVSDETGREEVYLRSYPDGGNQVQVSSGGGTNPLWGPGAGRLHYRRGGDLLAVTVADGRIVPSSEQLVAAGIVGPGTVTPVPGFDLHPRGGVLLVQEDRAALPTRLRLITGWLKELQEKVR